MSEPFKRCCLCERSVPLRSMCSDDTETPIEHADAHCANDPNCNIIRSLRYELNDLHAERHRSRLERDRTVADLKQALSIVRSSYEETRKVLFDGVFGHHFESCSCSSCSFLRRVIPETVRPPV